MIGENFETKIFYSKNGEHVLTLLLAQVLFMMNNRRMSPELLRGTVNLIGGELDVDEPIL
jgi:hypothetical protein